MRELALRKSGWRCRWCMLLFLQKSWFNLHLY